MNQINDHCADSEKIGKECKTRWETVCRIGGTYGLKAFALLVCLIVFISGFFTTIRYTTQESVHSSLYSSSEEELAEMLFGAPMEQNVFNVIPALFVGYDDIENEQEAEKLQEQLMQKVQSVVAKYKNKLLELTSLVQSGSNPRARKQLIQLMNKMVREIASDTDNINIIKLDKLSTELEYDDERFTTLKAAQDLDIRMGVMLGYSVGYVYLQIVSLVYIILFTISLLSKNKGAKFGKFFILYLSGWIFLTAIGQLSACSVNCAGMFCFNFALIAAAICLSAKAVFVNRYTGRDILTQSLKGISMVFAFIAFCMLLGNFVSFASGVGKIGSAFGLHAYDRYQFIDAAETMEMTLLYFTIPAVLYLGMLALTATVLFIAVHSFDRKGQAFPSLIPVSAVSCAFGLISYFVLGILGMAGVMDVVAETVILVNIVFSAATLIFAVLNRVLGKVDFKEQNSLQSETEMNDTGTEEAVSVETIVE